jgi:hypothetical protein
MTTTWERPVNVGGIRARLCTTGGTRGPTSDNAERGTMLQNKQMVHSVTLARMGPVAVDGQDLS